LSNRKSNKRASRELSIFKLITYFLTIIICAGLIFNGYFFESQSLFVSIIITAFFLINLIIFYRQKIVIYYDKKTILVGVFFILINIIGLFSASNLRDALCNVLMISNAIILYLLAIHSLRERTNLDIFLKGLYWTTVFVASLGLLSYIFGINILNSYMNSRIFSTLEYPNTAALFFVFSIFIGYYFMKNSLLKLPKIFLYSNSILFFAFIGTKSRGVFLLFPLLLLVCVLLHSKENRFKVISDFSLLILPSTIIAPVVFNGTFANRGLNNIFISIAALVILFIFYYFSPRLLVRKYFKFITVVTLLVVVGVGSYLVSHQELSTKNNVFSRFTNISFEDSSVQARFLFIEDALKIVKDNLLFGTGGGGWNAEYRAYRSYLYFTSEVHNHYLQVLVENGILGFVAYLGLWFLLISNLWRKHVTEKSDSNILLIIITLGLMLHSFIDFDLTFPAVYFLFWLLIAVSLNNPQCLKGLKRKGSFTIGIVSFACLLIINTSLFIGWNYGNHGTRYMAQNNFPDAIEKLENSIIFDPINSAYLTNLSQLYFEKGISDHAPEYKEKAIDKINNAIKYYPTNFEWYLIKTRFLVELGKYEEAYQTALKAINLAPFEEVVYYDTARIFIDVSGNEGMTYAEKIVKFAAEEGEKIRENPYEKFWGGNKLYSSGKIAFLEGQLFFENKQYYLAQTKFAQALGFKEFAEGSKQYLQKSYALTGNYVANGGFETGELSVWTLNGSGGNNRKLVKVNDNQWLNISKENIETDSWGVYQLLYAFEPGQKYDVSFDAFSKYDNGEMQLIVHQLGEDGGIDQKTTKVMVNKEIKKYNWIFQTDNLNDKHSLRLYFLIPNDAKAQDVYIKDIKMSKIENRK